MALPKPLRKLLFLVIAAIERIWVIFLRPSYERDEI